LLPAAAAAAIARVKGAKRLGQRAGNWLTVAEAQQLLDAAGAPAGATTHNMRKSIRDRALLAILLGCGVRREEAAWLDSRATESDPGVPEVESAKPHIQTMRPPESLSRLFLSLDKRGRITGESMTAQAIYAVVRHYARKCGFQIAPHDLRRTFAKLARKGRADIEQIQLTLGHSSIRTTQLYLGDFQDLQDAPCDRLGITVERPG